MRPLFLFILCSCSAVVSPDPDLLGGDGFDAGRGPDAPRIDAGPGNDSGPPPFDAGRDTAPPPVDAGPGCEDRPPRCEGNEYVLCIEGRDVTEPCPENTMCDVDFGGCQPFDCPGSPPTCRGADVSLQCAGEPMYTPFSCDGGCNPVTGLCNDQRFRPSNLGDDAFVDGAPDLTIPPDTFEINTNECSLMNGGASIQQMNNGESACVWTLGTVQMPESSYVRVVGQLPLIIIASGDVSIEGTFDLRAEGNFPGGGGYFGGVRAQPNGFGESGGRAGEQVDLGDGGGGGGGGLSDGGRGGNAGGDGAEGGLGGSALMTMGEPLRGGSGGGIGRGSEGLEGIGGGGGGAIQISALGTINLQGTIRASGGGGGGGGVADRRNWGAGGGGGAGGMILLESPRVEMQGTLSVSGGGGGSGVANSTTGNSDGEDGPISGTARGGQRGNQGGDGGGETPEDGDRTDSDRSNGGGGGGSAGIVIVRGDEVALEGNLNPNVTPIQRAL